MSFNAKLGYGYSNSGGSLADIALQLAFAEYNPARSKSVVVRAGLLELPFGLRERLIMTPYPDLNYAVDFFNSSGVGIEYTRLGKRNSLAFAVTGGQDYNLMMNQATNGIITIFPRHTPDEGIDLTSRLAFYTTLENAEKQLELGLSITQRKINSAGNPQIVLRGFAADADCKFGKVNIRGQITSLRGDINGQTTQKPRHVHLEAIYEINKQTDARLAYKNTREMGGLKLSQYNVGVKRDLLENTWANVDWKAIKLNESRRESCYQATLSYKF